MMNDPDVRLRHAAGCVVDGMCEVMEREDIIPYLPGLIGSLVHILSTSTTSPEEAGEALKVRCFTFSLASLPFNTCVLA